MGPPSDGKRRPLSTRLVASAAKKVLMLKHVIAVPLRATGRVLSVAGDSVAYGSKNSSPNKRLANARIAIEEEKMRVKALHDNLKKEQAARKEDERAARLKAQAEHEQLKLREAQLQRDTDAIQRKGRQQAAAEKAEKAKAAHFSKQAACMKQTTEDDTALILEKAKAAEINWDRKERSLRQQADQERDHEFKDRERQHAEQSRKLLELESDVARLQEADGSRMYWLTLMRLYEEKADAAKCMTGIMFMYNLADHALALARIGSMFRSVMMTCVVIAVFNFFPYFAPFAPSCRGWPLLFQKRAALEARAMEEEAGDFEKLMAKTRCERKEIAQKMEELTAASKAKLNAIDQKLRLGYDKLAAEKRRSLSEYGERLIRMGHEVEQVALSISKSTELPAHWMGNWRLIQSRSEKFAVFPVDDAILTSLKSMFTVDYPEDLGFGRDVPFGPWKESGDKKLELAAAWRIENPSLFKSYSAAVDLVARDMERLRAGPSSQRSPAVYSALHHKLRDFRRLANEPLRRDVNETFLLHGTKPETVLPLMSNGLNERFCGGLFGNGVYLAEDPAKNDQYTTVDQDCTSSSTVFRSLHNTLYHAKSQPHPGDVYYILLCRVVLGHFVSTRDGQNDEEAGKSVWVVQQRELAVIPGTDPSIHYHSLIAQSDRYLLHNSFGTSSSPLAKCKVERHREILQFNAQRIYPAYLLAYKRIKNGQPC